MKRKLIFFLSTFLILAFALTGCGGQQETSGNTSFSLTNEQGVKVPLDNMSKPALIFFFTGVT